MKFSFEHAGKTLEEITTAADNIAQYVASFGNDFVKREQNDVPETSINLPADSAHIDACTSLAKKLAGKNLKYILDVGIGGSNLGTKAVYDALFGAFDGVEPDRYPKMIFCDTADPEFLHRVTVLMESVRHPEEVLINIISKSGSTTETVANAEIVLRKLGSPGDDITKRIVVTTDEGSPLDTKADELGVHVLHIPHIVGGRYSVLSDVGLFPLAAAGVNIDKLCEGAVAARDRALNISLSDNPSLVSAALLYLHAKDGKNINDNFFFHTELESLGKWYRQLMGESIGKDGKGITPTVSIGSTDLHSMAQLYYGGPRDKVMTVVTTKHPRADVSLPSSLMFNGLVNNIEEKKASEIMKSISDAVLLSFAQEKIPFMHIELDAVDEYSLGEFLQFKMIEMMFLGKLLGVNPFDQPHVEIYKKELRHILAGE